MQKLNTANIIVVIATSNNRTNLLIERALKSVYEQVNIIPHQIYIIDDNKESNTKNIRKHVVELREKILKDKFEKLQNFELLNFDNYFHTTVLKNNRTKGNSGTGAWNTGIIEASKNHSKNFFIAFLDDDDQWFPLYLQQNYSLLSDNIICVISGFTRIIKNNISSIIPIKSDLIQEKSFIKNIGLQGSNLFINLDVLLKIGLFDESLTSTTDRDLLIRLLKFINVSKQEIEILEEVLVNHYAISDKRVTSDLKNKCTGLDTFYRKYNSQMDTKIYEVSLKRAKELFDYKPKNIASQLVYKTINCTENVNMEKLDLIIGVISDNENQINEYLNSFNRLLMKYNNFIKNYKIIVLQNGKKLNIKTKLQIEIITMRKKETISTNRTYIQKYIYKIIQNKDSVIWITDDDHLFKYNQNIPNYFKFIMDIKNNNNFDAILGMVSDSPPIPFLSMIRTQMLDFLYNLDFFYHCSNMKSLYINKDYLNNDFYTEDFYYDLSTNSYVHLEKPYFWTPDKENITNEMALIEFLTQTKKFKFGINLFRKIKFNIESFGTINGDSIYRGGNTIIFNHSLLEIPNYTNRISYNRRSDFNWSLINKYCYNRVIKEVVLPLQHTREHDNITFYINKDKLKADIVGLIFYRVLEMILKQEENKVIMKKFEKMKNEILLLFEINIKRAIAIIEQIIYLLKSKMLQRLNMDIQNLLIENIKILEIYHSEFQNDKFMLYLKEIRKEIVFTDADIQKIRGDLKC